VILWWEILLFVSQIAQGSGQVEVAIDATLLVHTGARGLDPLNLDWIIWLVIFRQRQALATVAKDASAVTSISNKQLFLVMVDQNNVCSATNSVEVHLIRVVSASLAT